MSVWSKIYERINWKDLPQRLTALAARNLNKMDLAIDTLDDRTIGLNTRLEAVEENPITVDTELKPDSANPVQNKVIYAAFEDLLPEETVQGNPISINDASGLNAKACSVDLLPIQDLHGYDSPWVGGAGKNLLPMTVTGLKSANVNGTWSGNVFTLNNVSFTILTDSDENVTGIKLDTGSGGASGDVVFYLSNSNSKYFTLTQGTSYILTADGATSNIGVRVGNSSDGLVGQAKPNALTFTADSKNTARIGINVNGTASNLIIKPMIRLATVTDATFAPYSNICSISGRTQASVTRTGANVWDEVWEQGGINVNNGNNQTADNRIRSKNYIPVKEGEKYYTTQELGIFTYNANKVFIGYLTGSAITGEFTIPSGVSYIRFRSTSAYGETYHNDIAINYPSTVTTYSAYEGETVTVQFGQTVYGGTPDVTNGKLTIDKEYRLFNGTENWQVNGTGTDHYFYYINLGSADYAVQGDIISDKFTTASVPQYNTTVGTVFCTPQYIRVRPFSTEVSVSDWKTWLQSNNVQVVFGIQTPIEITLTPEEISLLKGNNVVNTDGDNIILKYSADIKAWVENQLSV